MKPKAFLFLKKNIYIYIKEMARFPRGIIVCKGRNSLFLYRNKTTKRNRKGKAEAKRE
jgi:hypothetical protein